MTFYSDTFNEVKRFSNRGSSFLIKKMDGSYFTCDVCGSCVCTQAALYPTGHFYCCNDCEIAGEGHYLVEAEIWIVMP